MKKTICLLLIMIICSISLCGCISKNDVVGVWRLEEKSYYGNTQYVCYRKDGTGDCYRKEDGYSYGFIWKIDGDYVLTGMTKYNEAYKEKVENGKMYDLRGNLVATKISDDPYYEIND